MGVNLCRFDVIELDKCYLSDEEITLVRQSLSTAGLSVSSQRGVDYYDAQKWDVDNWTTNSWGTFRSVVYFIRSR